PLYQKISSNQVLPVFYEALNNWSCLEKMVILSGPTDASTSFENADNSETTENFENQIDVVEDNKNVENDENDENDKNAKNIEAPKNVQDDEVCLHLKQVQLITYQAVPVGKTPNDIGY